MWSLPQASKKLLESLEERVSVHKGEIYAHYDYKQQQFPDFVLSQYVKEGVGELDQEKLPSLLELKYNAISDVFVGFQRYLYE